MTFLLAGRLRKVNNMLSYGLPIFRRTVGYETADRWTNIIGDRDIVGFGKDGSPAYFDEPSFPCPAIRFQRNNPFMQALREKEKCDWRNLSYDEKRCLYRASFCQTYSEMLASTGEWKLILGWSLIWTSVALWLFMALRYFCAPPWPKSVTDYEYVRAQVKRAIDMEYGVIDGMSSHWDYEKECWKPGYSNKYYSGEPKKDEKGESKSQ
ncbi:cytochrome c oxidase subunit 4 isoform 1, mitochondrial isoform X2 [Nilaparvata lugens]|uniref:cytochrome c oxidase subunit 4 isoform 1, mitochondrial isoform X1 n=1 Tax=Nilaparvata lugens TaxID=108931 RepID=UPI00193E1520|nr:cytochrome c oxidase subunit 4 isoform 1, mitochondrial isoform X1 [Nilaparvata lugens]XP_039300004.1 cytochrome c oxidase subunit 4 isoform 1, mitochondrial isoform X2 [Nilaparvata lugens]